MVRIFKSSNLTLRSPLAISRPKCPISVDSITTIQIKLNHIPATTIDHHNNWFLHFTKIKSKCLFKQKCMQVAFIIRWLQICLCSCLSVTWIPFSAYNNFTDSTQLVVFSGFPPNLTLFFQGAKPCLMQLFVNIILQR